VSAKKLPDHARQREGNLKVKKIRRLLHRPRNKTSIIRQQSDPLIVHDLKVRPGLDQKIGAGTHPANTPLYGDIYPTAPDSNNSANHFSLVKHVGPSFIVFITPREC
jgi:hypothetical protein